MFKRIATAALIFGMTALAPPLAAPATAQTLCAPREAIIERLSTTFGEIKIGVGLQGQTAIYEVWTSETTGSWTILQTRPNGVTCIMAAGEIWRTSDKVPLPDPEA